MSAGQRAALNLYLVATNAHWTVILISLPLQADLIGGAEFKGTYHAVAHLELDEWQTTIVCAYVQMCNLQCAI